MGTKRPYRAVAFTPSKTFTTPDTRISVLESLPLRFGAFLTRAMPKWRDQPPTPNATHSATELASERVSTDDAVSSICDGEYTGCVPAASSHSDALGLSASVCCGYDLAKFMPFTNESNFPTAADFLKKNDDKVMKNNLPDLLVHDPNIPPTKGQQNAHLHALCRNRREEFVGPLRRVVFLIWREWDRADLSSSRFEYENVRKHSDEARANVRFYEHVEYRGCAASDAGITLQLQVDHRSRCNKSFPTGSLLLLSFSRFHPSDVEFNPTGLALGIICVTVVRTTNAIKMLDNGTSVREFDGGVSVVPVAGTHPVVLARLLSDESLCEERVWMLEGTNFYLPYDRTLSCLQATVRGEQGPRLDGALLSQASLEKCTRPPLYLEDRELDLSMAIVATHPNLTFTPTKGATLPQDALPEWSFELEESIADELSHRHVLDDTQRDAIVHMLTSKVAIVQGPPGTGKSFVGEKFLQILFENRNRLPQLRPILLLSETNHALDAVLLGLQRYMGEDVFNRSVARFGTRATDPSLEEVFVNRIAKGHERAYVTGTECTSEAIIAIYSLMMNLSDFTWKRNSCSCTDALRWMESIASALPRTTVSESIVHLCRKLVAAEKNLELFVKQQIQRAQDILCALSSTPTQVADVRKQHLEIAAETDSGASGVMVDLGIRRRRVMLRDLST